MTAHPSWAVFAVAAWVAVAARADMDIPIGYQQVAKAHGIPSALFYALALAESGRWMADQRTSRPWPWALNIEGSGQFYPSRQTALSALARAIGAGKASVDVGLMQISWRFHQAALGTPTEALDPYRNLAVAAEILVRCHRSPEGWWAAVGCYHAPNAPERAERYRARVRAIWTGLHEEAETSDARP